MPGRGEERLSSITYSQIADWAGLTVHTVRSYACRGQFDPRSLESVLRWVNTRRRARGWPLVGQPGQKADNLVRADPAPTSVPANSGGYDPQTGEFE